MKKYIYYSSYFLLISLAIFVLSIISGVKISAAASDPRAQVDTSYCAHGSYGYNAFVATSTFRIRKTVNFCLQDDTRIPLFIGNDKPWKIVDVNGNTVFVPIVASSTASTTQPDPTWTYYDSWDQRDNFGHFVETGTYSVVFTYPNNPSASFEIIAHPKKHI